MKKTVSLIIAVLIILISVSGCQKTPDKPIVIGKDIDNMIDKAGENPVVAADTEALRQMLGIPGRFSLKTESKNGNLKINSDAEVILPNAVSMPIARVTKRQFTEEDVKRLYNALCKDAKPISSDAEPLASFYLKQAQRLRETKENGAIFAKEITAEDIDREINALLAQAASAPKNHERAEPDFSFKENKDEQKGRMGEVYSNVKFMPNDNIISSISVLQDPYEGSGAYAEYLRDSIDNGGMITVGKAYVPVWRSWGYNTVNLPKIKQDDAQKLAQDVITKLELTDFACTGSRLVVEFEMTESGDGTVSNPNTEGAYEFAFTRQINNVPVTYTDNKGLTTIHDAYFRPWMYERILVVVDDEGILFLKWVSPYTVKEVVSNSSTMTSFSNIQDIFAKMIPIKYDHMVTDDRYSYEMKITHVRLGLMRITEKDVGDSGLLVPVWDFFGTNNLTLLKGPGQSGSDPSYETMPFITINAIDGSIIDRDLGY